MDIILEKAEIAKALKFGTRTEKLGNMNIHVMKKEPKPYEFSEYWECPKCYWKG